MHTSNFIWTEQVMFKIIYEYIYAYNNSEKGISGFEKKVGRDIWKGLEARKRREEVCNSIIILKCLFLFSVCK